MLGWLGNLRPRVVALAIACVISTAFVAGATASAHASGPCGSSTPWTTFGGDNARTGENACEDTIGTGNVGGLHELWSAPLAGPYSIAQPTYAPGLAINGVAHDVVFVADEHGRVQALDAATGAVLWKRSFATKRNKCPDIPDGRWGVSGAPVLDLSKEHRLSHDRRRSDRRDRPHDRQEREGLARRHCR